MDRSAHKSYGLLNRPSENPLVGPTVYMLCGRGWVHVPYEKLTAGSLFFLMDADRCFIPNEAGGHFRIATMPSVQLSDGKWYVCARPARADEIPEGVSRTRLLMV